MREQGCTIAAQVHRRRVLSCQASTFAFIQVVFTREPNQMILLESGFHIANFSVVPDRVAGAVRSAPTLLHTGAEAEVGTEATMIRLRVAGWEVEVAGESVFMVTGCSEDGKLELLTDFVLLDLGATKTVEVAVRAVGAEAVKLPADRVVAVALACDTDTAVPRVLAKLGQQAAAEPEDAGERWAGLSAEEKSRLAEERKLEGNTLFLGHKFEAALEKYTEAIELNPADATFFSNRAACHLNLGRPELGLADARHATKLDPQYAKGWLRGLRGSIQLGDMEQAKQMADRVLGLSAELRPLVEEEVAVMVKVETLQAELEEAMGKEHYSQALHCLDQLATCCPQGHMVAVARAEILAQKGSLFRVNEVLVQAFGTAQDRMEVYYIKGLVNYYQDKLDDAFQDLSRVLEVEPGHKKARSVLSRAIQYKVIKDKGKVLYMAEDFEAACQVYTDALTIDKLNTLANAKLYYNRAVNRAKLNKLSETVDDLTTAVQLDKGYTKAYLRRAQCFMELESYDEAVKDFERVVLLEPKNNEYGKMLSEASQKLRSSKNKDFYALLGVEKTASLITIKKAYRKAAMTHHPDRHSGTEEAMRTFHEKKFKDIGEAYSVLSDEDKRRKYDQGTLYNTIQAQAHAQHVAQAAQAYVAQAQAQAALLARLTLQAQQRQQGLGGIQPGLGLGLGGVGLMGVGPGGRPGGISPAWLSGVPGVAQRLPFPFAGPVGRGGGPLGGLLGGLPGAGGLLGAPQLNPRFPGFRFQ
jgi:DnaJ family protein C protein 7